MMKDVYEDMFDATQKSLAQLTQRFKDELSSNPSEAAEQMRVLLEAVGFELGYIDGLCWLGGAPQQDREASIRSSITEGKRAFLEDATTQSRDGSGLSRGDLNELRAELEAVN